MATYKLIQDVEAEDHIIGPLTLRQFIFTLITVFFLYICFICLTKHATFLLAMFLPPAIFFGFFAIPFGRDQPTEVWFLAKLRFWFKPRRRIWSQSGVKELVKITAPKKVERVLTNNLSPYEVESRLKTLANTLDSRGWAVKSTTQDSTTYMNPLAANSQDSTDRLMPISILPEPVADNIEPVGADIMEASSPVAYKFDQMIGESSEALKEKLLQQMNAPEPPKQPQTQAAPAPTPVASPARPATPAPAIPQQNPPARAPVNNQWFMPHVDNSRQPVTATDLPANQPTMQEEDLIKKLKAEHKSAQEYNRHMHVLNPVTEEAQPAPEVIAQPKPVDPVIMSLASRNDFTIETIKHEADKAKPGDGEVVISLH